MTPDEKRRLYILIDRDRHMDATTIWFYVAIGLSFWALLAVLGWVIWTLGKHLFGGSV